MQVQCLVTSDLEAVQAVPATAWNVDPPIIHVEVVVGDLLVRNVLHSVVNRAELSRKSALLSLALDNVFLCPTEVPFKSVDITSMVGLSDDWPCDVALNFVKIRL